MKIIERKRDISNSSKIKPTLNQPRPRSLFFAFLLQRKDALETRLTLNTSKSIQITPYGCLKKVWVI